MRAVFSEVEANPTAIGLGLILPHALSSGSGQGLAPSAVPWRVLGADESLNKPQTYTRLCSNLE